MLKTTARILGFLLTVAALSTSAPRAEAQQRACTLFCIQGYHCCVDGNSQSCVPLSQPCK
jgi:hypothetical protein